ncbi:MAG TPA: S8 family serine peptidase [Egibacteraceae bacterium]|nr:S8 family serine peptidase [Egibacteraceae bacterium]
MLEQSGRVHFEAAVPSAGGASMFAPDAVLALRPLDEFRPQPQRVAQAAAELRSLGFAVRHIGSFSVSGDAPRGLWEQVFDTHVEQRTRPLSPSHPEAGELTYLSHVAGVPFAVPSPLEALVERAYPQPPPTFHVSPLPPRVPYHHLRVPSDVAMLLRATHAHRAGITGDGVRVAMPDTGFYSHPFYDWHGYRYQATLAPDALHADRDDEGHGTAMAANILALAPAADLLGVKMGGNATLAFKTAAELEPAVISNSWGYDLPGVSALPNFLRPLEAAVAEAVSERGIAVCFSAGNGDMAFPGMMPQVLSVGGVHAHDTLCGEGLALEASDYASSFTSLIYPGRHVPDVCGLVGMQPKAIYIMLPVQPGNAIDVGLSGTPFPEHDETAENDGWAVLSGTSAACPQVAGVCALLRQVQPGLSPVSARELLKASARDVSIGRSAMGEPADHGHDGATGAGLVDAHRACLLAGSAAAHSAARRRPGRER